MSDKNKKDDFEEWNMLSPGNLDVYHTKEFEEAKSFTDKDDFHEIEVSSKEDSFTPIVEGQSFDGFEEISGKKKRDDKDGLSGSEDLKKEAKEKDGSAKKDSRLDVMQAVVEQEKEASYKEGLEEGKKQGEQQGYEKFLEENKSLREEEKAKGFEEGKALGFETGREEAYENAKKEFEEKSRELMELMESLGNSWNTVLEKYEENIVELSLNIARRVLYSNLTLDPDFVKLSIKEALKEIPDPVDVTIGVNPDDYNIIEMIKEDFFQRFEALKNITIVSDPSIGRGGCTIESESGGITQTVENRLKDLEQALLKDGLKKNRPS